MKLKRSFWIALTVFSLMGQIAWVVENMYFNVFIYKTFNATASDISLMVAASAVTATLTTVFMGALSDKIGKRKLFIVSGYILWGISIFSFVFLKTDTIEKTFALTTSAAAVGVSLAIVLDCVMTFFGSTANDAAFNAWLTDCTDSENRGRAEGINAMMPLVAVLVVFGGFMFFNLDDPESWTVIFSVIGALTLVIGVLGIFLIKEPKVEKSGNSYFSDIIYGFKPKTIIENKTLYLSLLAFIIFNISIQIFMPYLIIYYEVSLKMADYVLIMAPAIIIASVVTALWGKVYDKKGFNFSGIFALAFLMLGYVVLFLFKSKLPVFVGSLLMMSGYLSGMAVFGAVIRDLTPKGKSGRLQGVRIFSQVLIPGIVGPFIGKSVLSNAEVIVNSDGTTSFVPNEYIFLFALIAAVLVLPFFLFISEKKQNNTLTTDFEKDLGDTPFPEYPRPNFKRESFFNLNGKWQFCIKNKFDGEILVPFPPESRLSGVEREIKKTDTLIYTKKFNFFKNNDRVILHFGACDQIAKVFLNGNFLGENEGGYLDFSFDVTDSIREGENTLVAEVLDKTDLSLPYGKQRKKRGGMWYTKISGIWQTVWLECVCENYIKSLKLTPDLNGVKIEVEGGEETKTIHFDGKSHTFSGDSFYLKVENPILWDCENPHLYDFKIVSGKDEVDSYFALREVKITGNKITLNGKEIFLNALLDQGYFPDGIFTPATYKAFENDILFAKECGFNTLRKHIKLEPKMFYYFCDKYGMLVMQDFVNSGKYHFLRDTLLPTLGIKKLPLPSASSHRKSAFEKTNIGIVNTLHNHPSVIYYTIFNEGWGQFNSDFYYRLFKKLDPTRIFDTASGWFKGCDSDVVSEHIYFKKAKLKMGDKPTVLSEFGGYSYKVKDHSFNLHKTFGYRFFKEREEFENALISLYKDEIVPLKEKGLCGAVLTQISDVEDETNGLITYDRKFKKISPEKLRSIL